MMAPQTEVTLTRYCRVLKLDYHRARLAAIRGELTARQDDAGFWWVPLAELERRMVERQAESFIAAGGNPFDEADPAEDEELLKAITRFQAFTVEAEVALRTIEGDARESEQRGDAARAARLRQYIACLRSAVVSWDAERGAWRLEIPGLGVVWTRSTLSPDRGVPA
jgi:hypothetical protein